MASGALLHLGHPRRPTRPRPTALVALSARVRRHALDRELAAGIAGWRSPAHAARVSQLTSRRTRRRLAAALDRVIVMAAVPPSPPVRGAVVLPCRDSIEATADQIRELARRLRADAPVGAAGVIRLHELLCDGVGPVYTPGRSQALSAALASAARWLDVGE